MALLVWYHFRGSEVLGTVWVGSRRFFWSPSLPAVFLLGNMTCSLLPWRRLFDPGPWGWSWWIFWSALKGSRSPGRWSAQSRLTQFVSGYQRGSPLALVSCVVLALLPARLLMVVWCQHISHCSPSHCSGKYQTSPDLSKCQVLVLISFFLLFPTNLPVRSPCASLKKWISTWIFISVNMVVPCDDLKIPLKRLRLLFGFEVFQIGSHCLWLHACLFTYLSG